MSAMAKENRVTAVARHCIEVAARLKEYAFTPQMMAEEFAAAIGEEFESAVEIAVVEEREAIAAMCAPGSLQDAIRARGQYDTK